MKLKTAIFILFLFHISGVIAILFSPYRDLFLSLTPLNLLISTFLVGKFHSSFSPTQVKIFGLIAFLGFSVEALGVATGKIFGVYHYGPVLGWKIFETPLMIGVNWILLTYSMTYSWSKWIQNKWILALVSAFSLVLFDVIIEPVAINYNLWRWETENVPLQNFMAWGIVAFIFCYLIAKYKKDTENPLAPYLIWIQISFFSLLFLLS